MYASTLIQYEAPEQAQYEAPGQAVTGLGCNVLVAARDVVPVTVQPEVVSDLGVHVSTHLLLRGRLVLVHPQPGRRSSGVSISRLK